MLCVDALVHLQVTNPLQNEIENDRGSTSDSALDEVQKVKHKLLPMEYDVLASTLEQNTSDDPLLRRPITNGEDALAEPAGHASSAPILNTFHNMHDALISDPSGQSRSDKEVVEAVSDHAEGIEGRQKINVEAGDAISSTQDPPPEFLPHSIPSRKKEGQDSQVATKVDSRIFEASPQSCGKHQHQPSVELRDPRLKPLVACKRWNVKPRNQTRKRGHPRQDNRGAPQQAGSNDRVPLTDSRSGRQR